jgi:hypothetical protein
LFVKFGIVFNSVISRLIFWLNLNKWDNLIGGLILR